MTGGFRVGSGNFFRVRISCCSKRASFPFNRNPCLAPLCAVLPPHASNSCSSVKPEKAQPFKLSEYNYERQNELMFMKQPEENFRVSSSLSLSLESEFCSSIPLSKVAHLTKLLYSKFVPFLMLFFLFVT